jgi:hypothetical protein
LKYGIIKLALCAFVRYLFILCGSDINILTTKQLQGFLKEHQGVVGKSL